MYDKKESTQAKTDFAACLVRMAGHDFMDFRWAKNGSSKGGSDGCINFEDGDNKGLPECLAISGTIESYNKNF